MAFLTGPVIPEHILKLLSPEDRKQLGKGAITREEAIEKAEARAEKELQEQILTLLEAHRGIVVIYSRMDRKATTPVGTPDFIFSVHVETKIGSKNWVTIYPCAWEIKTPTGEQSDEQIAMQKRMETPPNAWRFRIIRSVAQARSELAEMGLHPRA